MATDQMQAKPASVPRYEAVFEQQLGRAVGRVRFLDVTAALLGLGAATLLYALVVIGLDRWLVLPAVARQAALILYLVAACAYLGWFLVRPLYRPVNPYYAAKRLEQTLPEAKNSVVNWLDLRHRELPGAIRVAVGQRAAHDVARADLDTAISGKRTAWAGSATGLLFVALLITLGILGPSQFWSLLGRAFGPFSAGVIRTRTQIELHQPQGDAVVPVGRSVAFAATITGKVPAANRPDAPRLLFRYRQTDPYEERPLERERDSDWATNLPANQVHGGFWYKIAAGDAETDEYQVRVRATPSIEKIGVTYHYRPYLGWKDSTSDDPKLEAVRGTEVVLIAHANRKVKAGQCLVEGKGVQQPVAGELVPGDPNALQFKFVLDRDGQYRIAFTSTDDETNPSQVPYPIKVLIDRPPEVILKKPGQDITLPSNGLLQLEGSASDDLGVERMTLRMQVDGQPLQPKPYRGGKPFKLPDGGYPKMLEYKDAVELDKVKDGEDKPFELKPKMVVEYWLEAADACDYPKPNIGESTHYKVTIGDPDKDHQKQKQDREQASKDQQKHEQQQDQQLAKENQQRKQDQQEKNENPQQNGAGEKPEPQPGQEGDKDKQDQQADNTQEKLNQAFDQQDKRQNSADNPDSQDPKSEPKDGSKGEGQPQPGKAKGKDQKDNKDSQGVPEGQPEQGQDKGEGANKDDGKGGARGDAKPNPGGKGQEQGDAKQGGGEGANNAGEKKENGQQQSTKSENAGGKSGGKDGAKPDSAQPKGKGENKSGDDPKQGEGKGPGTGELKTRPSPSEAKPDDKQPTPSQGKDINKGDATPAQPKDDPGKGSQGKSEQGGPKPQGAPKEGAGTNNSSDKKNDQKDKGGSGTGSQREKSNDTKERAGGGDSRNSENQPPKPLTKPGTGDSGEKPGENAKPQDIAKLAEQLKMEKGEKKENAAKQLAQAAQNAKDAKAREEARKALEQNNRDPRTGEPTPAAPKKSSENQGQQQQSGTGSSETKKQPDKKDAQTGNAKGSEGGQNEGTKKSEPKKGDGSQGRGKDKGDRSDQKSDGPAKGDGPGKQGDPGRGNVGGGQRSGDATANSQTPEMIPAPPDPRDRLKKGELLLERFDKMLARDKQKFLEDAKISEEDLKRLRDDIAHRKAQLAEKPEQAPKATGPGSRNDKAAARVQGAGKPRASDTQYGGPGSPPPEFRDVYREFTSGSDKK